ncbi:conserved hypothetical protein [Leishmania braziliensis MHOM/BR/75/M2904]|uniref:Uncharacterized protein n=1 Tax=Leishmania braziliensis TaxID=5660 RepID=A4HFS9_LEIBR|nr:conserved hypothetical protein [Leishmania braziliensis MHOM/BR/75/M2904]CAJ2475322.1 unnamed protein product [Leishmania braziliensis]CAM45443.2 conserved hypothetical protein [Leishmania braziliensis MHOM/BR/75/M2904]
MRLECIEGLSVRVALAYWSTSFLALLMRLFCAEFANLASYGGHSAPATAIPDDGETNRNRDGKHSSAVSATTLTRWCAAPVHWIASSMWGRWRVTRKQSFIAFYVTGLVTGAFLFGIRWMDSDSGAASGSPSAATLSSPAPPPFLTCVPLLLFSLHCTVRLTETCLVQRFREHDTVTLFAAVAGISFYVMAAISSAAPSYTHVPRTSQWIQRFVAVRCVFGAGVMAHLSLQAIQVTTHTILARLRQSPSPTMSSTRKLHAHDWEEGLWRRLQARLATSSAAQREHPNALSLPLELDGAWRRYHLPYSSSVCFQVVLDPHYTCEVAMYAVNTILLLLCTFPNSTTPATDIAGETLRGMGSRLTSGDPRWWGIPCTSAPWLSVLASVGVTVFTAANLSITSAEHRCFWVAVNATRRLVGTLLRTMLDEEREKPLGSGGDRLPAEVVDATECMLQEAVVEEVVPRWNLFPLVW